MRSPEATEPQHGSRELDELELETRRRRNRESMRRVRLRKRDARVSTQQTAEQLELTLRRLVDRNRQAAAALLQAGNSSASHTEGETTTYSRVLAETAALSLENQTLRRGLHVYQELEAAFLRSLDEQRLDQAEEFARQCQLDETFADDDALALLRPLLSWLSPSHLGELVALTRTRILENKALIESLVPRANVALGWSDRRCVEGRFGRYLLSKRFSHSRTAELAQRTWVATTDIRRLASIMRWAHGMKVLYWLSDDAAVVTRELEIPNAHGSSELPTKFRFMLLVFRCQCPKTAESEPDDQVETADGDCYMVGTVNLNVFGSTVAECLEKDVSYRDGANAHTMYGFIFRRLRGPDGRESGCHVTLTGLTGNGSNAYAHNVLMEMIPVVLLWENALVGPILRLQSA